MKFISLFSGIGGFDLALERAGMECVAVCEIDKNAQSVLRRHFPKAELFDDVRKVGKETHDPKTIDLVCGGFPCQDVSIAGRRKGLAGERSGLWFEFARVIDELEPQWVVIENVPGLLSSNGGKDFAVIVRWLAERGYGVAWRILDAQFFGVPQRRRRVFIVASFGNGSATEVLFESEGGERDYPKGGETGKEVAYSLRANASHSGDKGDGGINTTMVTAFMAGQGAKAGGVGASEILSPTLKGAGSGTNQVPTIAQTLSVFDRQRSDEYGEGSNNVSTISARDYKSASDLIWHNHQQDGSIRMQEDGTAPTVSRQWGTGSNNVPFVGVRRLMPIECERLQGFPEVEKSFIIDICLDHQKNCASVEIQNPKSLKYAGSVGKGKSSKNALYAKESLQASNHPTNKHAQPNVLINCGERKVEVFSQEKLFLSANFAESKNLFPPHIQSEDFALLLVGANSILDQITRLGAEELHQSALNSIVQKDGRNVVRLSGKEIMQLVSGAVQGLTTNKKLLKSIISNPLNIKISDITLTILFYSVMDAINGCIPKEIRSTNSFRIEINTSFGWTFGQSDTVRYRQLGNAVAVPVVEWIGKRIMVATR